MNHSHLRMIIDKKFLTPADFIKMTIKPLERILIEPGCFYIEMVKTSKKYKEKSPIVKPADASHEQHVPYHC